VSEHVVLAFDFGVVRIGVAVGNTLTKTAQPLGLIESQDNTSRFSRIADLIREWDVRQLVVGIPRHPDGQAHELTERCERFARQLEGRTNLPVARVDERYTSVEAASLLHNTAESQKKLPTTKKSGYTVKHLDAHAAALILEQYFSELQ
jgi:putative Holliday junction resolvase